VAFLVASAISSALSQPSNNDVAQWEQLNGQAAAAYQAGEHDEGLEWAKQAFELAERIFGPRDPNTLTSLNNLAFLYQSQGRYGEAEPLFAQALQTSRESLGESHPSTLTILNNLALIYQNQGRYGEAEPLLAQALQLSRESLGESHPTTLLTINNLAMVYQNQGRYGEAEPLLAQALQLSRESLGESHPTTLTILQYLAMVYQSQGRVGGADPLLAQALRLSRESLGESHPTTLTILSSLGMVYESQGRFGEAEPLLAQALRLSRESLGESHPTTLTILSNLGMVYQSQGRFGEAEPLLAQALQLSREVLGDSHPSTLTILNNLARLFESQGRYGEAEPLHEQALQLSREVLGGRHPDTLISLNNLAGLYERQGRNGEAEPLLEQALQLRRAVLGERHPDTLQSLNNLAFLYERQGRNGEAEPLYEQALQLSREVLGGRHSQTLISLSNLAALYARQGRYGEAEPLYEQALQLRREVLGDRHPDTLTSLNNLAALFESQGRYGEAEPLFEQALQLRREVLGERHPDTLLTQLNSVVTLVNLDDTAGAVRRLRQLEPQLLSRLGAELYATESAGVRRGLVASQSTYQDVALSLSIEHSELAQAQELASSAVLRFKGLQGEEEAWLARLSRRGEDPRIRDLAGEIRRLRAQLAQVYHGGAGKAEVDALTQEVESKELALGRLSRDYEQQLQVRNASLDDLRGVLTRGATLVEFRPYSPVDFRAGALGAPHWAAVVVQGFDRLEVVDLGPVAETRDLIAAVVAGGEGADAAARTLYARLLEPLHLDDVETIVIAPDGALHLVPFHRLRLPDGRFWTDQAQLRVVQTGRDLLRPAPDRPAKGLLALGGIDFDAAPVQVAAVAPAAGPEEAGAGIIRGQADTLRSRTEDAFRAGFAALPGSGEEVERVAALYRAARKDESVETLTATDASEIRLKALERPPRVLHLATHGFYRAPQEPTDWPMLLAGVTLAGANQALKGNAEDGILYAIEAQDLNLEGTELVVLSACETAQGQIDYGEGVYGLVRALRTAGAQNVLVTLRPVGDQSARDFMVRFYRHWLSQTRSDPALALQETQREYITRYPDQDWSPFVLIGGASS
jgi:tetratricopeptide (TPR) repeat protein/CHAT domain-containing protein